MPPMMSHLLGRFSLDTDTEALIGAIYEAGVMPRLWPLTLQRLANHAGADGALLMVQSGGIERWVASPELAPAMTEFVNQGWSEHNVRATRCRALSSHAGFLTDMDIVTAEELEALPIYTEFLRPRGLDAGVGTTIQGIGMDGLMLTVEGFRGHSAAKAAVSSLNKLRPHLARAAALSARMKLEQASAATDALSTIGTAAAVLASDATILSSNSSFDGWIGGLLSPKASRLSFADAGVNADFRLALDAASRGAGRSMAVRGQDKPHFVLHVVPLIRSAQDIFHVGIALAIIDVPGRSAIMDVDMIRRLYDLTPSEAKVAHLVAGGATPAEAARALGVSMETIRTHLKRTFAKTGTDRQTGLSSQLRGLAPRRTE